MRRGSLIAKRIIDDRNREAMIKARALRRKAIEEIFRKRRGESNGKRTEPETNKGAKQ